MFREVQAAEAQSLVSEQGFDLVDVRTPREFAAGHPDGSVNVPVFLAGPGGMMPNPEFLQVMQRLYATDRGLVLSCASGARSGRACQLLGAAGFGSLVNVVGGFTGQRDAGGRVVVAGWADLGLPVSTDVGERGYDAMRARAAGDDLP